MLIGWFLSLWSGDHVTIYKILCYFRNQGCWIQCFQSFSVTLYLNLPKKERNSFNKQRAENVIYRQFVIVWVRNKWKRH